MVFFPLLRLCAFAQRFPPSLSRHAIRVREYISKIYASVTNYNALSLIFFSLQPPLPHPPSLPLLLQLRFSFFFLLFLLLFFCFFFSFSFFSLIFFLLFFFLFFHSVLSLGFHPLPRFLLLLAPLPGDRGISCWRGAREGEGVHSIFIDGCIYLFIDVFIYLLLLCIIR